MNRKPIVIGIAGGSGSGKTTICNNFENILKQYKIKTIHNDEYFKPVKPKVVAPFTQVVYQDYNHPDSIDFDKMIIDITECLEEDYDIIFIEGHLVFYIEELRNSMDLKVYVDCRSDERLVRRIKRCSQWGQSFEEITSVYLDAVRYRHDEYVEPTRWHADMIINGSSFPQKGFDVILSWIEGQLRKE